MNKRRLLKLAELLKADANNPKGISFDMNTWGESTGKPSMSCNTQACAMGVAAVSGAFKADGLRYKVGVGGTIDIEFGKGKQYRGGLQSAVGLFGISWEQAERLFMASSYPLAKQLGRAAELAVAYRIRRLVASAA